MATEVAQPLYNFGEVKMEPSFTFSGSDSTISPIEMFQATPSVADSEDLSQDKPSKKRRSWGQQLPTPTTNLPPRKRAKTEAEKEQRRIERVIRNRLAAHSSRERKRREVEHLEGEKQTIEAENSSMRSQLMTLTMKNSELTQLVKTLKDRLAAAGQPTDDIKIPTLQNEVKLPLSPPQSVMGDDLDRSASPEPQQQKSLANSTDMTQHPAEML